MTLTDSFLFNAGWLFFAAWTAVVSAVSFVAFGHDLLRARRTLTQPVSRSPQTKAPPNPAH